MFKYIKQLTSIVAVFAILFAFTTETMAAKKSKTLKNTQKKGFVRCGVSQGLPGFSNADASEIGQVLTLMYVEQLQLQYWVMQTKLSLHH